MVNQSNSRAVTKYIKTHMRQYIVRFQNEAEADMIEWLDSTGNVTQTIKRLIRAEMEKESRKEV